MIEIFIYKTLQTFYTSRLLDMPNKEIGSISFMNIYNNRYKQ